MRKIAVLGMKHDFEFLKEEVINIEVFIHVKGIEQLQGVEFSNYILLEKWEKAYQFPDEILHRVKLRIR